MLLGGAFGRRGPRDEDFILPALLLSREVKKPVKVMWTREDDLHNGRFRPLSAWKMYNLLGASGGAFIRDLCNVSRWIIILRLVHSR
jgi:isoquinoline 1-oxidoreductase subunit beta